MNTVVSLVSSPDHSFPDHEEAPSRFKFLEDWEHKPYPVTLLDPIPAPLAAVKAVHTERMLHRFEAACLQGPGITDCAPTFVTPTSYFDAFRSAGGALLCTEQVLLGRAKHAFAIVRPPGHHAEPEAAMGFCLLNNVSIAAQHALDSGLERVLIFDFDAHHGNGTQAIFWNDARVAFLSTHQENIYPYRTGSMGDAPHARGRIVNLPLPPRSGDGCFLSVADELLAPLVRSFAPQMILVSAGFDSHWDDPLAELGLSSAGYHTLAKRLLELADEVCKGKLVFVLEGGYNPRNIASGVDAILCALANVSFLAIDPSPFPEPDISGRLRTARALHGWQA